MHFGAGVFTTFSKRLIYHIFTPALTTGSLYVISTQISRDIRLPSEVLKFTGRGEQVKLAARAVLRGALGQSAALDDSGDAPVLWLGGRGEVVRVEDVGRCRPRRLANSQEDHPRSSDADGKPVQSENGFTATYNNVSFPVLIAKALDAGGGIRVDAGGNIYLGQLGYPKDHQTWPSDRMAWSTPGALANTMARCAAITVI